MVTVYRRKWVIHIERITREKVAPEDMSVELLLRSTALHTSLQPCTCQRSCSHHPPGDSPCLDWCIGRVWLRQCPAWWLLSESTVFGHGSTKSQRHQNLSHLASPCGGPVSRLRHSSLQPSARPAHHSASHVIAPVQVNGATVNVGLDPSKVVITKLKIDKDRKALLERKAVRMLSFFLPSFLSFFLPFVLPSFKVT